MVAYVGIEERKRDFFQRQLSSTDDNTANLERAFYMQGLAVTTPNLNTDDLKMLWLIKQGVAKTNVFDMWVRYLTLQGFTRGGVYEKEYDFYGS